MREGRSAKKCIGNVTVPIYITASITIAGIINAETATSSASGCGWIREKRRIYEI
jgi:hypothetical protein